MCQCTKNGPLLPTKKQFCSSDNSHKPNTNPDTVHEDARERSNISQSQLSAADAMIISLEEQVAELLKAAENDTVVTYCDGKFIDMRTCCISLLGHNVGINNLNPIITEVLQLAGKHPSQMPSYSLLRQMVFEGRAVALSQLSEVASENSTLHYDGTTKFGRKYGGFQLTTARRPVHHECQRSCVWLS